MTVRREIGQARLAYPAALVLALGPAGSACSDSPPVGGQCRPITSIEMVEVPTLVWGPADQQEPYHLPDGVFDAFWSNDLPGPGKSVSFNMPSPENYRLKGPSLVELQNDVAKTFSSSLAAEDTTETAYNYRHWVAGTYTLDGTTVYALGHHEWYGCLTNNDCMGDRWLKSWVNSITHFTSTDGGASWSPTSVTDPPTGHVVVHPQQWPAWPYTGQYYNHHGMFMPSGIIRDGDHFYSAFWYLHRTGDGPTGIERQGISMLRTRDISQVTGWEVLNAAGVFESLATATEPFGLMLDLVWGSHSQAIVYDPMACQYVMFFAPSYEEPLVKYATSATLGQPEWSTPAMVGGTDTLEHDGYVGILDPDSDGLNFESVGETPYFFYAVTDTADVFSRELYRRPLKINHGASSGR